MAVTVTHTARDELGNLAGGASVTITEVDAAGVDVPGSTHGPYAETAASDGTWSKSIDNVFKYRVDETLGSWTQRRYINANANADIETMLFTPTAPAVAAGPAISYPDTGSPIFGVIAPPPGIPGGSFLAAGTTLQTIDRDCFIPLVVPAATQITSLLFNVTGAPASNANVRLGIYHAKSSGELDDLIYDGVEAVASGFTGVKTHTVTFGYASDIAAGLYFLATNLDVAMTLRSYQIASLAGSFLENTLVAASFANYLYKARTYAAFPEPGSWDTIAYGANPGWTAWVIPQFVSLYYR